MLHQKTTRIDLNSVVRFWATLAQGIANEHRTNNLFATYGLPATRGFSSMRATIQRRSQNQNFLMLRPISRHGLRTINQPRIAPRHRSFFANIRPKTLSRRIPQQTNFSQHTGQRQPDSALANLRRLCTNAYNHSYRTLRRYRSGLRSRQHHLRIGFNHHRPMPFDVSVGNFSYDKVSGQNAHAAEYQRLDTRVYPYFRGFRARCEHSRRAANSAFGHLFDGSRLFGLLATFRIAPSRCVFRHSHKIKHTKPKNLFGFRRQIDWLDMRPDHSADEFLCRQRLSRPIASSEILRCRNRKASCVPDQLVQRSSLDDCDAVSRSLAGGVVFQMDQTTPANKTIFRHDCQCRQDTDMDCRKRLRPRCDCQKTVGSQAEPLHFITDFKSQPVRENAHFTGLFANRLQYPKQPKLQPTVTIQLMMGQQ